MPVAVTTTRTEYDAETIERVCRVCREAWPATVEFFHTARNALGEPYLRRACIACYGEQRRRRRVILGPCACQGCGRPVFMLRVSSGGDSRNIKWRDEDATPHVCLARARAEDYNVTAGVSGQPNTIASGRSHSLTPSDGRLIASVE